MLRLFYLFDKFLQKDNYSYDKIELTFYYRRDTIVIEATGYKQFISNYFNLLIELETPLNISKIKLEFQ
jgi:hypothetical protein